MLLIGYAYAHWSVQALGIRRQLVLHGCVLVASAFAIPLALPELSPLSSSPVLSIAGTLAVTIGLPFILLAANSSLVQRWYSVAGLGDPFHLYATSNAGSLLALLGYPLLFEPIFGLTRGWRIWVALYVVFIGGSALCMWMVSRSTRVLEGISEQREASNQSGGSIRPTWSQCAGWTFRGAVATSLLLSVTMKITTDIASAPIFWVIPLSLYLLSFIAAFSPAFRIPRWLVASFTAVGIAWALTGFFYAIPFYLWLNLVVLLSLVFFGCLLCHGDLSESRPSPQFLTHFYLWIALGGTIGGMLNSLLAPVMFRSVAEYPITLFFLVFLIHTRGGYRKKFPRERMRQLSVYLPPVTVVVVLAVTSVMMIGLRGSETLVPSDRLSGLWNVMPLGLILFGLLLARHAGQFEFVVACLIIYAFTGVQTL